MQSRWISERSALAAVFLALSFSIAVSATSMWQARSLVASPVVLASVSTEPAGGLQRLKRVRLPDQPDWQQRFFEFDRSNARLAGRLVLTAKLLTS